MENRKYIKFLIPVFILGFFIFNINSAFAYEVETHAFLTNEIAKFYNQNFPNNSISTDLTPYLIDGSRREDDAPRWMNHFYDPVYNRGFTISLFSWQKSKDWAQDDNNQNSLVYKVSSGIASVLSALEQDKITAITSESDFTWQQAIKFYNQDEKEKAIFMLGHILHLIEDTSVPDHTRNDPHPGDSPYEIYTSQFNLTNPDKALNTRLNNKTPIILSGLNSYFDGLANYSNNNFYSKDTIGIQSGYDSPIPDYFQTLEDGRSYGIHSDKDFGNYPIVMAKGLLEVKTDELLNRPLIMLNYWSRLSTKSVEYGAGLINLFLQQAEAAKNNSDVSQTQPKSFLSQVIDVVTNFFSDIFGNNQNLQPVAQITLDTQNTDQSNQTQTTNQQTNQITQTTQKPKTTEQQTISNKQSIDNQDENLQPDQLIQDEKQIDEEQTNDQQQTQLTQAVSAAKQCSFATTQPPSHQGVIINEVAWMGTTDDANNEWIELKNISVTETDITNWQLIDKGEQIKIIFASINGSKNIQSNQFILLERTDDNSVPNITADLIYTGALSNTDEGLRLFDGQCNLIDETLANPNWPAGNNTSATERKTMERDASGFNWHTASVINGTPKKENSTATTYSGGGGSSGGQTSNNPSAGSGQVKILINEIQIAPTSDRFIELYNPNDSTINLTNYYIQRKTQTGSSFSSLVSKTYFENKIILSRGYFLISRSVLANTDIVLDNLTLTESNTIQIKNSDGEIIDKVGWGQANDCEGSCAIGPPINQSIQRKFQNNTFVDTDNNAQDFEIQTCPSPKAQSQNCQEAQAPTNYVGANHIVISEIEVKGNAAGDEFIELYNPANSSISLDGYSIQYLSGSATSTAKIIKKNFNSLYQIAGKSFFLLVNSNATSSLKDKADMTYASFSLSGNSSGATIFLVGTTTAISNLDDLLIIDSLSYGNPVLIVSSAIPTVPDANKSLERKATPISTADSMISGEHQFLGNGYDSDNPDNFILRDLSEPQNSLSFPEPRNAPTEPEDFNVSYSSSTLQLNLNWQPSQDFSGATSTINYQITKLPTSDVARIETTSTEAKISIDEIGRDHQFSIQTFDKDGLSSEIIASSISVPSFLSGLYFYTDPRDNNKNLIEAYYNNYPFVPDLFGQNKWALIVFNLDSDAKDNLDNNLWQPNDLANVLRIKYNNCVGGLTPRYSLILPNSQNYCGTSGGAFNSAFAFSQLEDNHFIIELASSSQEMNFTENDFTTAVFYTTYSVQTMDGRAPSFQLAAIDKTKYYFGNLSTQEPPKLNGSINLNFDSQNSRLYLNWPKATDSDTLDYLLTYEIKYNDSDEWQLLTSATSTSKFVSPGDNLQISLRAKDDFNNYSSPTLTVNWSYPETNFCLSQTEANNWSYTFGQKDGTEAADVNLQSIAAQEDFQFNKVVLKIRQTQANNDANLKLSVYASNSSGQPDFTNQLDSTIISNVFNPGENQDITFSFANPISLSAGNKYWLVLEVDNYNSTNSYNAWHSNSWQNATADDVYSGGEAGKIQKNWDSSYSSFSAISDQDWYMKIGLGL